MLTPKNLDVMMGIEGSVFVNLIKRLSDPLLQNVIMRGTEIYEKYGDYDGEEDFDIDYKDEMTDRAKLIDMVIYDYCHINYRDIELEFVYPTAKDTLTEEGLKLGM